MVRIEMMDFNFRLYSKAIRTDHLCVSLFCVLFDVYFRQMVRLPQLPLHTPPISMRKKVLLLKMKHPKRQTIIRNVEMNA